MTNSILRLPDAPKPPDDPLHYLLNNIAGWRDLSLTKVETSPEGMLQLTPKPGTGPLLADDAGTFGGLTLPTGVAMTADGSIYLLDTETGQLKRFDQCECRFENVPCTGGLGAGPREVDGPHGIAIFGSDLFICDTGNRRVQVFALKGMTLRSLWGPLKLVLENGTWRTEPAAPQGNLPSKTSACDPKGDMLFSGGVWQPWDIVFDQQGRAFVTDAANGVIHRFGRNGRWQTAFGTLTQPTHLAIDRYGRLFVMETGSPDVVVFDADGKELERLSRRDKAAPNFCPLSFATDSQGNLYLSGLCEPKPAPAGQCAGFCSAQPALVAFNLHGNPLSSTSDKPAAPWPPVTFEREGIYLSQPLDSGRYRCQWHRLVLEGDIPIGTAVMVESFTAEVALASTDLDLLPDSAWRTQQTTRPPVAAAWDCLFTSPPGRFLNLRLTLTGNGTATPRLHRVKVFFPRISLRRYLPAVFAENPVCADFTDRLLAVFDTIHRSVETEVDNFARYLDAKATPAERDPKTLVDFLSWLGSWVGLVPDRAWDECRRRRLLQQAGCINRLRGTSEGLRQLLLLFLGWEPRSRCGYGDSSTATSPPCRPCVPPTSNGCSSAAVLPVLILEHFKLRRWLFLGEARLGDQSVLWGRRIVNRTQLGEGAQVGGTQLIETGDPVRDPFHVYANKFSVFIPAACARSDAQRATLQRLIALSKPAHTVAQLELVEPRFRIGFQSCIGLDSVVGRYPRGFTLANNQLGRDTALAEERQGPPTLQVGEQSRIGSTTILD